MAEPIIDRESILQAVKKDSTERLLAEIQTCFPSSNLAELKQFTRDEIIEKVVSMRVHLNQTTKATSVLEGILTLALSKIGVKSAEEVKNPVSVPTDLSAVMLAMTKIFQEQMAAQEKLRVEEREREKKAALEEREREKKAALEKEKAALEKEEREKKAALEEREREKKAALEKETAAIEREDKIRAEERAFQLQLVDKNAAQKN